LEIDESSNLCGLKLIMVIIYNLNDEITPNTDWEFRLKNARLDYFKIYIYYINCKLKNCARSFKFNHIFSFHHLIETTGFFCQIFFIAILDNS
jgi:hypothetical protein